MARDELQWEDLTQLAKAFGFDDVRVFETFVAVEQQKADARQEWIVD